MIGHFSADELASYRAGMLSESRSARIGVHLSTCTKCADVDSGLADVSTLLASLPVPPMPEQLTARLQVTIANEVSLRSAGVTRSALSGSEPDAGLDPAGAMIPGRPDLPERTRTRRTRRLSVKTWTSPSLLRGLTAAAVLVVLVGGGVFLATERGPTTAKSAGSAPAPKVRNRPSAGIVGSAATTPLRYKRDGQFAYANAVTSAADYTRASLPAGVRDEVRNSAQVTTTSPGEAATSGSAPAANDRISGVRIDQLESCLSAVATGRLVLLVDVAHYLGNPATIIVLKPVNNVFDVIVVGQACGTSSQDVITRVAVPKK